MTATCEIKGFTFSAAHSGLHDGVYERMHGHTYTVTVWVHGEPDRHGVIVDFTLVKQAMRELLQSLHHRVLIAREPVAGTVRMAGNELHLTDGAKRYVLPAEDVALLPVANTTTEAIADHLLNGLIPALEGRPGLYEVEIELAESPGTSVIAAADLMAALP
ncbi:MAG TPA: 6-carboxytetrahydropterin synthase [Streptosporangiaceae bacterium]|jgi:6-pyruvoyltetrahydropterin/6-carboxytetrahydropterin synthase